MISIYDPVADTYTDLDDYIQALGDVDQTVDVIVRLMYAVEDIFALAQKESALRGRYARTEDNQPLLEVYNITADEEDTLLGYFKMAATDIQKKLAGWARNLLEAFQFNVNADFGTPSVPDVKPAIIFFVEVRENSQFDLFKAIDEDIANALFTGGVKEWFMLNNIPAFEVEAANYATFVDNARSNMMNINLPIKTNIYPQT